MSAAQELQLRFLKYWVSFNEEEELKAAAADAEKAVVPDSLDEWAKDPSALDIR